MQGIYNYIPETNHVSRVYSVAAVLYLQFALRVMLFRLWNMFCTFTLALSAVCVQCRIWLFLYFLNFMLSRYVALRYCLSDFEMVPVAPIITGITLILQPTRCTCCLKLLIFVKHSTCFGRSFRPSSGAQNCVYSNGVCQTAAATSCYRGWDGTHKQFWALDDGRKDRLNM